MIPSTPAKPSPPPATDRRVPAACNCVSAFSPFNPVPPSASGRDNPPPASFNPLTAPLAPPANAVPVVCAPPNKALPAALAPDLTADAADDNIPLSPPTASAASPACVNPVGFRSLALANAAPAAGSAAAAAA